MTVTMMPAALADRLHAADLTYVGVGGNRGTAPVRLASPAPCRSAGKHPLSEVLG
jgi:hypothetical protein